MSRELKPGTAYVLRGVAVVHFVCAIGPDRALVRMDGRSFEVPTSAITAQKSWDDPQDEVYSS